ncbi:MAG: LemA family protein [Gaiellaceae bacterium]|jgi:LemA protein
MTPLYVVLICFALIALLVAISYNGLVRLRNKVEEAWRDVDVQLQRRHDLIPRLVEVVKGYAAHESTLFEELTRLRSEAEVAQGADAKGEPEARLAGAIGRAVVVAESYPTLRASESFLSLQKEIAETEDEIAASRDIYNDNVRIYDSRIQSFPVSYYADLFGFEPAAFFQADADERESVPMPV